jgi:polyribonucleotide nucleotidyltransferase
MKFNLEKGGKNLEIEVRGLAEQANAEAFVRCGDTMVLATCLMSKEDKEDLGFFPLTVEYQERYYAAGKIKGSRFVKRENRPTDEAICNSRLIDRAIRPLFPDSLMREVQIIATVLSWDGQNDPDVLSLIAASAALNNSDIPWDGPVAGARVCKKEGKFILNPSYEEREKATVDIVFAGILKDGKILVNMIEAGLSEASDEDVLSAFDFCHDYMKEQIDFQSEIKKKIGKEKISLPQSPLSKGFEKEMADFVSKKLESVIFQEDKNKREIEMESLENEFADWVSAKFPEASTAKFFAKNFFNSEADRLLCENIIKYGKRPDGRKIDELRKISCEVGLLPRTHGSGLFCRGQTKALSILTLGAPGDQQLVEGMEIVGKKRFMHHYNFPPYCTGEIGPLRGPGRREIGHGMLAEKALLPLIPESENFPYTIRIVSEMLSSNGSTSMASVSSSSLALMDAGVPIKAPATGIAIGIAQDKNTKEYKVLTDIQGPEDHHGGMDFKVAGTRNGITAIQLDVKIDGVDREIMEEVLLRAKNARLQILDSMQATIAGPRPELSPYAPRIITIKINPDKIREVIGPGGKVINEIIDATGASIDIDDTGLVFVTADKKEAAEKAVSWIKDIVREVVIGETFKGTVTRILPFGAFVEILPGQEGMIHISKLSNRRVERVEDIVNIGDEVTVKVILVDEQGRINLSLISK